MRGRLLILIGLIVLLAIIAVVVILPTLNQPTPPPVANGTDTSSQQVAADVTQAPTPTPIPLVKVVQALQNLPRGYRFPNTIQELENIVGYATLPEETVPFNAIKEQDGGLEKVLGKIARTDIFREQPILSTYLVTDLTSLAAVGSDAAAVLPSDRVAVSLPMDRITSVAYGLQDGDHVDVIISMLFIDVDEVFQSITPNLVTLFTKTDQGIQLEQGIGGRIDQSSIGTVIVGPAEHQRPRLVTQRTIQDALVVHVGEFPLDGHYLGELPTPTPVPATQEADSGNGNASPPPPPTPIPPPNIVTLGVSPQYAVVLVWAIDAKLPVTLALRSVNDRSTQQTAPVTLDYMMQEFHIEVPARRDYSIEPAIRSIRQLVTGNIIDLSSTSTTNTPPAGG
jgi:Flp pilus assembly protein CpaB